MDPLHSLHVVLAGVSAGISGTIIGAPFDFVKVRLQARKSEYKGTIDCLAKTVKNEGVKTLFRGVGSPLFSLAILNALSFGTYAQLNELQKNTFGKVTNWNHMISGVGVGFLCSWVSCPFEVVKIRMQLDSKTKQSGSKLKYRHSWDCFKYVFKTEGTFGFYRGNCPNIYKECVFGGTYFSVYEFMKKYISKSLDQKPDSFSLISILLSGGIAGASAWFMALPFDVIKTHHQQEQVSTAVVNNALTKVSQKMWITMKEVYATSGVRGFYVGVIPAVARAFVVSSSRFATYEFVLHFLSTNFNSQRNKT